jgi:acyl dehydratase
MLSKRLIGGAMSLEYESIAVGDRLPVFSVQPTIRNAVMYAAAMWEFQRIHYDHEWARGQEGLPGAVVQGPVLGNYLAQAVAHWTGPEAALKHLEWRNHGLVAFGDTVNCEGTITAKRRDDSADGGRSVPVLECALALVNQRGEKVLSGAARVELRAAPGAAGAR